MTWWFDILLNYLVLENCVIDIEVDPVDTDMFVYHYLQRISDLYNKVRLQHVMF